MSYRILLSIVLTCCVVTASAQQGAGLSRQVEVTKDYVPDVSLATKLQIAPRLGDTATIRPNIQYSLTPIAIKQQGAVELISPARVSNAIYGSDRQLWVKAGGGYPTNTELDFYGVNSDGGSGRWGGFINHKGLYSNVINDFNQDVSAADILTRAGLFGRITLGRKDRLVLEGEGGYSYDYYARYAYMQERQGTPKQLFAMPYFNFSFGHSFDDLSYWNFRAGGSIYYLSDKFDCAERGVKSFLEVGKSIVGSDRALLRVEMENYEGRTGDSKFRSEKNYTNTIIRVLPSYEYLASRFSVKIGANIILDNLAEKGFDAWILPEARVGYDLLDNGKLVAFVQASGDIHNNGLRSTTSLNPYYDLLTTDFNEIQNTRRIDLRGGFGGDLGSSFAYKLYGGYTIYKRLNFASFYDMRAIEAPSPVAISYGEAANIDVALLGVDLRWRIAGYLNLEAGARGYHYGSSSYEHPINMPNFDANISARYTFNDKISAWAGAEIVGKRYFRYLNYTLSGMDITVAEQYVAVDPVVDLSLGADYRINNRWAIYAKAENLTGSKLYLQPHYPGIGARVTVGVKVNF